MAKEIIDLSKVVYNKNQYTKVIDTQFNQLISIPNTSSVSISSQINDFFIQYQNLFFENNAAYIFLIKCNFGF